MYDLHAPTNSTNKAKQCVTKTNITINYIQIIVKMNECESSMQQIPIKHTSTHLKTISTFCCKKRQRIIR